MGTVIGIGGQAGWLDAKGRLPGVKPILLVDSLGAAFVVYFAQAAIFPYSYRE